MLCFCSTVFAWTERGNGRNIILCENSSQNKFYDAFEAEYLYGLRPVFPFSTRSCDNEESCLKLSISIAQSIINQIPEAGHRLKVFMHYRLNSFVNEAIFLDNVTLSPVNDTGITLIPKNCTFHQTIIQREPRFKGDKRYVIANDKWKKLPPEQQAVGFLHELLYSYALHLRREGTNSELIRYFNAILISGEISRLNNDDYYELHLLVFKTFAVNNEYND